jgi:AraC-like DNA-binding protein
MSTLTPHTAVKGDSAIHRQFGEHLAREISSSEVLLMSTLPRGGLQILQPSKVPEAFLKAYARQWQTEDDAAWRAITTGMPVRGDVGARYTEMFLGSFDYKYVAAVPVKDPVFSGYVGVLEAHRAEAQGGFSGQDLEKLAAIAARLESALHQNRAVRGLAETPPWLQRPEHRQFIFDQTGEPVAFKSEFASLDERIQQEISREAKARLQNPSEEEIISQWVLLADQKADRWAFNVTTYRTFPSLQGPAVFFSILPSAPEWSLIRAGDFQADTEIARMVPALKFMQQEYHRGPSLTEIARTVHLSPFHFHRRFTELFGLTPKHFLLESQIFCAKSELFSGEKELVKIASGCGFAHQSHFTSRFKQATGLTPTKWRRAARAAAKAAH